MADQIDEFVDFSSILYRRPFDKGYMINPALEEEIWERIFGKHVLDIQCAESTLLLSEAPLNFQQMQRASDEMVFEQFGFAAYCRASCTCREPSRNREIKNITSRTDAHLCSPALSFDFASSPSAIPRLVGECRVVSKHEWRPHLFSERPTGRQTRGVRQRSSCARCVQAV